MHENRIMDTNMMVKNIPEMFINAYEIVSGILINNVNIKATASMML